MTLTIAFSFLEFVLTIHICVASLTVKTHQREKEKRQGETIKEEEGRGRWLSLICCPHRVTNRTRKSDRRREMVKKHKRKRKIK